MKHKIQGYQSLMTHPAANTMHAEPVKHEMTKNSKDVIARLAQHINWLQCKFKFIMKRM